MIDHADGGMIGNPTNLKTFLLKILCKINTRYVSFLILVNIGFMDYFIQHIE